MFTSDLSNDLVISDANVLAYAPPADRDGQLRGRNPRDWAAHPLGFGAAVSTFDLPLIPREEWRERIEEMERTKTRISDLLDRVGSPCKNQQQTNYCWINAPVRVLEIERIKQNERLVILSPASAGARIKNFANVGGWGSEGLQFLAEKGACPVDIWPANAIDRRYLTQEAADAAMLYRPKEWKELRPRNIDELISALLHRRPVAVGYNWWGHEVTAIDPVVLPSGLVSARIENSWGMEWPQAGAKGRAVLDQHKAIPDDAVCVGSMLPT